MSEGDHDLPLSVGEDANRERLRLRPEPSPATRLSRKVLVGLGLVAGLGISAALLYGLRPPDDQNLAEELYFTDHHVTTDDLAGLPRDYTAGPPPGLAQTGDPDGADLVATAGHPASISPASQFPAPEFNAAEQLRMQEAEAARTSRLFATAETRTGPPSPAHEPETAAPFTSVQTMPDLATAPLTGPPSARQRHLAFVDVPTDRRSVAADRVIGPASPFVLQAGSIIAAALITGIRSDLPGQITAQVTEHVYDSPTGRFLLIPQGARLIGQYDSGADFGERRVLLVWTRLILPNGRSIVLDRQPGADGQGFAGLEDGVDYHWWSLAKAAALSSLLGIGSELAIDDGQRLLRAVRDGTQDTINDAGQQIIRRELGVQPTLTIRPGFPVRIIVTRDLVLERYEG